VFLPIVFLLITKSTRSRRYVVITRSRLFPFKPFPDHFNRKSKNFCVGSSNYLKSTPPFQNIINVVNRCIISVEYAYGKRGQLYLWRRIIVIIYYERRLPLVLVSVLSPSSIANGVTILRSLPYFLRNIYDFGFVAVFRPDPPYSIRSPFGFHRIRTAPCFPYPYSFRHVQAF